MDEQTPQQPSVGQQFKPDEKPQAPAESAAPETSAAPTPTASTPISEPFAADQQALNSSTFHDDQYAADEPQLSGQEVSWEASEYIHHEKDMTWYIALGLIGAVLATIFVLLGDWIGSVIVVLMVGALIVYANRRPNTLTYRLSDKGLTIGDHHYAFEDFRSFGFWQDGAIESVVLQPMRRFMPPVSLYFPQEEGESIGNILSTILPYEEYYPDTVDRLIRRLRF